MAADGSAAVATPGTEDRAAPARTVPPGMIGPAAAGTVTAAGGRKAGALAFRDFRLLWIGLVISAVGSWVQDVADLWLLLQLTNSALFVGLRGVFTAGPFIAGSFFGGALADRFDRRRLLALTQVAYVLSAGAEGLLVATGRIQFWQIYLFGTVNWTIAAIDTGARQSLIPGLVPRHHLSSAIALVSSLRRGSGIIGPVIGGLTIATLGIGMAYFVNAASFLPVLAAALLMRATGLPPAARGEPFGRSVTSGLRYAAEHRVILGLILMEAGQSFCQPVITMMPLFARDVFKVGPEQYGLMLSMMGIGALTATVSLIALGPRFVRGKLAVCAALAYPAILIGFSQARDFRLALLFLLLLGLMDIVAGTLRNTIVQIDVDDGYRGRVISLLATANRGASPLGAVPMGALVNAIGPPLAMTLGSLTAVAATVTTAIRVPHIWNWDSRSRTPDVARARSRSRPA